MLYQLLMGHTDFDSAVEVDDYPYGRLRTKMRYWVEHRKGFGNRLMSCTLNPKTDRWNKPHASTYTERIYLYRDLSNGHIKPFHIGSYDVPETIARMKAVGLFDQLPDNHKEWMDKYQGWYIKVNPTSWGDWQQRRENVEQVVREKGVDVTYETSGQNDHAGGKWVYEKTWKAAAALAKFTLFGKIATIEETY